MNEAAHHPHNVARQSFQKCNDHWEPSPAPKLSRTPGQRPDGPTQIVPGTHTKQILSELGYQTDEINQMLKKEVVICQDNSSKL